MTQRVLNDTRLLQRLLESKNGQGGTAWSFGGGINRGGLTREAYEMFGKIFQADYMGNSEFEFGEYARALQSMGEDARKHHLVASAVTAEVHPEYAAKDKTPRLADFYILASRRLTERAISVVQDQANKQSLRLAEPSYFKKAIHEPHPYTKIIGWLEEDNGFLIFADHAAFDKAAKLFGVRHNIAAPVLPVAAPSGGEAATKACG